MNSKQYACIVDENNFSDLKRDIHSVIVIYVTQNSNLINYMAISLIDNSSVMVEIKMLVIRLKNKEKILYMINLLQECSHNARG